MRLGRIRIVRQQETLAKVITSGEKCGYNGGVDIGIKQAKQDLSKLVMEVGHGKRVFLMNRGKRVAEIVPVAGSSVEATNQRGFGMFKHKIHLPADWDSQKARREATAEVLDLIGIAD